MLLSENVGLYRVKVVNRFVIFGSLAQLFMLQLRQFGL